MTPEEKEIYLRDERNRKKREARAAKKEEEERKRKAEAGDEEKGTAPSTPHQACKARQKGG